MRYTFNYFYKSTGMDVADERQYTIEGTNVKEALESLLSQPEIKPHANWFLGCLSITISAREIMGEL